MTDNKPTDNQPPIMQRDTERVRVVVPGKLTDNGAACTLVVVRDGRAWSFYPHGAAQLRVRIDQAHAAQVAEKITVAGR